MGGISALVLNENDNVATALRDVEKNEVLVCDRLGETIEIRVLEPIPYGFKLSIRDIPENEPVLKYGQVIGRTTKMIPEGFCVHVHNVESLRGRGDWE